MFCYKHLKFKLLITKQKVRVMRSLLLSLDLKVESDT